MNKSCRRLDCDTQRLSLICGNCNWKLSSLRHAKLESQLDSLLMILILSMTWPLTRSLWSYFVTVSNSRSLNTSNDTSKFGWNGESTAKRFVYKSNTVWFETNLFLVVWWTGGWKNLWRDRRQKAQKKASIANIIMNKSWCRSSCSQGELLMIRALHSEGFWNLWNAQHHLPWWNCCSLWSGKK